MDVSTISLDDNQNLDSTQNENESVRDQGTVDKEARIVKRLKIKEMAQQNLNRFGKVRQWRIAKTLGITVQTVHKWVDRDFAECIKQKRNSKAINCNEDEVKDHIYEMLRGNRDLSCRNIAKQLNHMG